MDYKALERKWQKKWEEDENYNLNARDIDPAKKAYVLVMFSYPSGDKLHVGHWYNFAPTDTYARFLKMKGKDVFEPMGFDAFGLPAENYAIKTGIHPAESTKKNIAYMTEQLKAIGAMYNWNNQVITCEEDYYKWTQWIFLKFYEKGLAYRSEAPVNWCPNDKTVLANEQVINGACERCSTRVEKKNLTQWFFKITDYAEELLQELDNIDWPDSTKAKQREWIGKSEGAEIEFTMVKSEKSFTVFTTRPDTLYGVTYVTLAPELELVKEITDAKYKKDVEKYIADTKYKSEVDRLSNKEKSGVFTGAYAINPVNGEKVPVWVSDYVLASYGSGAVMAVPGHDQRDFEFAKQYELPIKKVVLEKGKEPASILSEAYTGKGIMINSGKFDGISNTKAKIEIVNSLSLEKKAITKVNYKLRDWLISRQRYWGTPIPIIYCDDCGAQPVPEQDLPVKLPINVEFTPDGDSPLKNNKDFLEAPCPSCGKTGRRETDTMDTFVCSSWYFLRYPNANNQNVAFDTNLTNNMMPVDKYVGGPEHATMHLLYARFFTKALRDLGYLNFDEPFKSLTHQGIILGPDGQRMSKSKGNVISPDKYVNEYGADIFRNYLMFGFAYDQGGPWDDGGIEAIRRFFGRIVRMVDMVKDNKEPAKESVNTRYDKELLRVLHNSIKQMTLDLERLQFNTAISRMMEIVNEFNKYCNENDEVNQTLMKYTVETFIKLLAPFAPHFAEELWEVLDYKNSVFFEEWPIYKEKYLEKDTVIYVLMVNGKKRDELEIDKTLSVKEVETLAKKSERIQKFTEGKEIRKVIVVPNKIVNVVI